MRHFVALRSGEDWDFADDYASPIEYLTRTWRNYMGRNPDVLEFHHQHNIQPLPHIVVISTTQTAKGLSYRFDAGFEFDDPKLATLFKLQFYNN